LDYLGRSDDQVKIRGFRIELDEIRTVLEHHPAVTTAVVIAADHPGGNDKYLAAYYVGTDVTDDELREHLTARVPDYMIPTVFIPITTVPVTPNGKLDRRALPTPDLTAALTGGHTPSTVTETTLATVFSDILHLPTDTPLSIDDDFFRLGGDSISSIQVVTRARRAGITITAADIFTHRTISALARIADTHTQTHTETGPTTVTTAPLQPIAARYVDRPGFDHFTQSFVFTTPPDLTTDTLHRILTRVIGHHPTLQGRLDIDNSGAPHFTDAATPIEVTTRLDTTEFTDGWSGPRWPAYVTAETTRLSEQLDPTNGILWRALWCTHSGDTKPNDTDFGDTTGRLVMVIHHLAVDGVSWRILQDDLAHAWALDTGATDTDLLPAGTSITTWTHALTEQDVTEQLGHWSTVVNAVVPLFGETGIDQERHTQAAVTTIDVKIPAGPLINNVTAALSASVEDILLTAVTIATGTWRARHHLEPRPVTIGMEGHGRQETVVPGADLSRSIGWFTTWYPIMADLTDLDPIDTLTDPHLAADAVLRIKDTLARVPDRGIGYGILTHLHPDTALPTTTPDLALNYLGNFSAGTAKPWSNSPECPGIRAHLPKNLPAAAVVDVNIAVLTGSDGEPMFDGSFAYAQDILTSEQARELVQLWTTALQTLVTYASGVGAGRVRRSLTDFTASGTTYGDLTTWDHRYGDIADVQPLTPLQHGMVFESLLGDSASVDLYLTHTLVHVTGTLDNERLYRALRTLTEIYPNLKAAITLAANGDYVAVIPTHATIELTAVNGIGDADAVDKAVARNRETGFVLADAPLMRVTAVTTAADQHTLILTIHHAITDGWSTPPLIATLLRAYNNPTTPALPDTTYPSFLHWLTHHDHTTSLDTWTTALADVTEPTLIATTNTATTNTATTDTAQPIELTHTIDTTLTEQLHTLARTHSTTLNTVIHTAWALTLNAITGQPTITFGTTVSGRPAHIDGIDTAVGMFLNTIPTPAHLGHNPTAAELLDQIHHHNTTVLDHHHTPLPDLHHLTGLPALFDTLLVYENYPLDDNTDTHHDLALTSVDIHDSTHYPLTLGILPTPTHITIELSYQPHRITHHTITTLTTLLDTALHTLATAPHTRIAALPLLTHTERKHISELSSGPVVVVADSTLDELIRRQTNSSADALAVVDDSGQQWTYTDLDFHANALAHILIERGVQLGDRVAVMLPRNVDLVTTL
ncbi:hypothetical protein CH263_06605, partial [Rhodococcus sp. 06-1059B-a]